MRDTRPKHRCIVRLNGGCPLCVAEIEARAAVTTDTGTTLDAALAAWRAKLDLTMGTSGPAVDLAAAYDAHVADQQAQQHTETPDLMKALRDSLDRARADRMERERDEARAEVERLRAELAEARRERDGARLAAVRIADKRQAIERERDEAMAVPPVLWPGRVVRIPGPEVPYVVDKGLETSGSKAILKFTTVDGLDWAADRLRAALAGTTTSPRTHPDGGEVERLRANVEKLIIRNNQLTRERDEALRKAKRPALDLDALRGRLSDAAKELNSISSDLSVADDRRVHRAIDIVTDSVRVLYHAGGER